MTPSSPLALSIRSALLGLFVLALSGCWGGKDEAETRSDAEQVYDRASTSLEARNYDIAISFLEQLSARYPFSNQAKQAQLDLIYAYYKNGEREAALDAAEQFERENPTHPRLDYALYMRGLVLFSGEHARYHRWFGVDLAARPPVDARESFAAFNQLVLRYPDSEYAPDARQRMVFLRNRLADHQNYVARYYMRRGAFAAAVKRAEYTVANFDGAPAVADSLQIMVEGYRQLGMRDLAEKTERVLAANYPNAGKAKNIKPRWWKIWK